MYVVYADLVSSTAFAESAGVDAVAGLAEFFSARAMQVGRRFGSRPVKLAGDAVIFLSPEAAAACTTSLQLLDKVGPQLPLAIHIGIAHGDVVERNGDVFGLPVNLAARIASLAEPGTVVMDGPTARAGHGYGSILLGRLKSDHLVRPVELYRLVGHAERVGETA